RTWKDSGAPKITAPAGKDGDIVIESEHGLGYLGVDVKQEAAGFKSWGPSDPEPPHRLALSAKELKELAGGATEEGRLRAVDARGQQTASEIKTAGGK